jgi:hypothetical protein
MMNSTLLQSWRFEELLDEVDFGLQKEIIFTPEYIR